MQKIDIDEVKRYIESQGPKTKIYIGGDSERFNLRGVWYADYTLVVVVHKDGKNGCKLFGETHRERVYDQRADRPKMRLMTEVFKVADLYLKLHEVLEDRDVEVHLDISKDEAHGSSCAVSEAVGYIRGMCNVVPMIKPHAWAASSAADRFKSLQAA